jgi:hypothetical protein
MIKPRLVPYGPVGSQPGARPRIMKDVLDPSAAVLGLPSLAFVTLPQNVRELRLSRGHGMILGAEYPLIRIVEGVGGVSGEVIRFHGVVEAHDSSRRTVRWAARIVRPTQEVNWSQVLQTLDSLGIETFVSPAYRSAIMDAGDLTVEIRRGSIYRAYEVNAPQLREDSTSARAAPMARFVDLFERLTRGY